jgi:hypothetical protein
MRRLWKGPVMKLIPIICISLSFAVTAPHGYAQTQPKAQAPSGPTAEHLAQQASDAWLALVDSGQYAESWKQAAAVFQAAVTQEKWVSAMNSVREPLGKLQTRRLQSATYTTLLPGVPNGDYVVILCQTSFEHKPTAQETIIMSREKDKVWRLAGYYIK